MATTQRPLHFRSRFLYCVQPVGLNQFNCYQNLQRLQPVFRGSRGQQQCLMCGKDHRLQLVGFC